jgi:hypothetical protein
MSESALPPDEICPEEPWEIAMPLERVIPQDVVDYVMPSGEIFRIKQPRRMEIEPDSHLGAVEP